MTDRQKNVKDKQTERDTDKVRKKRERHEETYGEGEERVNEREN